MEVKGVLEDWCCCVVESGSSSLRRGWRERSASGQKWNLATTDPTIEDEDDISSFHCICSLYLSIYPIVYIPSHTDRFFISCLFNANFVSKSIFYQGCGCVCGSFWLLSGADELSNQESYSH